jgi:hypothetical protein
MPDDGQPVMPFERWVNLAGKIVAPATAVSALLFYFGYVSSRSQYEYFGLDVDTIGLTTQDFIMRSPQPLLVPLLVLSVLGAGAVLVHAVIRGRLTSVFAQPAPSAELTAGARRRIGRATAGGLLVLGAGMVLLFLYPLLRDWPGFNLLTPLVIALGGSITAYALGAWRFADKLEAATPSDRTPPERPPPERTAPERTPSVLPRPAVSVFILVAVVSSAFWATATVAQWSGLGLAQYRALHLDELPSVILDTRERLYLTSPGLNEVALPPSQGQTFHYRYRHLRVLIQGEGQMFLVPDRWSASDSTLLVRLDSSVRMQFRFTNQPP